ncbi:MAG TPA: hypothetical protein VFU31_00275 [Candidatus Binatia bacterium]|nr:hypothetical protein [Candidatus Binatia bacterium]
MDNFLFWFLVLFAMISVYRILSRRFVSPKARVAALLRRYRTFESTGLSEQESLFRILATRSGWKSLPHPFLREVVSRLVSKEDVFRFVSLVEGYRYDQTHFSSIAGKEDLDLAMTEIACLLANFGIRLQGEDRLKEAEFVQKLAAKLQPNQYFTKLPLAVTYYKMERYGEALSLFKEGLAEFEKFAKGPKPMEQMPSPVNWLGPDAKIAYKEMYEACLKAASEVSGSPQS